MIRLTRINVDERGEHYSHIVFNPDYIVHVEAAVISKTETFRVAETMRIDTVGCSIVTLHNGDRIYVHEQLDLIFTLINMSDK